MAKVKAGVAYVDVRLGSVEQFKQRLKSEIEKSTTEMAKTVGDGMAKKVAPEGQKVGAALSQSMTKSFLSDANRSFTGGLRAFFTGQRRVGVDLMKEAGLLAAVGMVEGLGNGLTRAQGVMNRAFNGMKAASVSAVDGIGNAFRRVPAKLATANAALTAFSQRIGFLGFQLMNFGAIASVAFTAPVAAILTFGSIIGIKTAVQIENATAALRSLTPAGTDVEALIKRLQSLAQKSPIFNSADLITFTQRMVASGLTIQQVEGFLASFGNIALTVGADISKIPFALEALVQMAGKGTVSMEELRLQLGDALPGAMTIVSEALGVTTGELYKMVEAGELSGQELIAALTKFGQGEKFLKGAAQGAETMGAKWQELKESVQNQLGQIFLDNADNIKKALEDLGPVVSDFIKEIGPVFPDLIRGFGSLIQKIGEVIGWYKSLTPEQQGLVDKLILAASVVGPLVLALGVLGTAIGGITALLGFFASTAGLVVLGAIGIGLAIFGIVTYFQKLYDKGGEFKEFWDNLWKETKELIQPFIDEWKENIWPSLKEGFDKIRDAIQQVTDKFDSFGEKGQKFKAIFMSFLAAPLAIVWGVLKGVWSALGPLVTAISSLITGVIKIIGGLITFIVGVFTGDWQKALDGLEMIWDGLWDAVVGTLVNLGKSLWNLVKGIVTGIVDFFTWLWDVLVGHSIVPDMVNAIIDWFKKMVDKGVQFVKDLGKPFKKFYDDYIKPFIDGVKRGTSDALDKIKELPGKIKDAFSSAGSWLINAGKDIVNGLIDGVRRTGGALKRAILDLIPGPVRGIVERALGINSPSRVFMGYGKNIVEGFIRGVTGKSEMLYSTVLDTFGNLTPPSITSDFGDARNPIIESRGSSGPAVNIENYNEAENDPARVAEDFYFMVTARGGVA